MSAHKTRAQAFWSEVFNAKHPDRMEEFVASGAVNHNALPGAPDGPAGIRASFERLWAGFPDLRFDVETMIAEADKVVCVGVMSGTHDGPFAGMAPTGRSFRARHIHVFTFDDSGLISEHLAVRDDVAQLKQLGLLPDSLGAPSGR